jgi:hypothetical protein
MGKTELLEDGSYTRFYSSTQYREIYFTAFKKDKITSGQYLVIKYRTEDTKASLEFWTSTENLGATAGDNKYLHQKDGAIIADGQWHTLVLDLSGWNTVSDFKGTYDLNYIRFDLFDYDKPAADESAWIDVAFMVLCDKLDAAISYDENTESVLIYDGSSLTSADTAE